MNWQTLKGLLPHIISLLAINKIEGDVVKTYAIKNLTYEQMDVIYRAIMAFEPTYPGGEETRNELIEAMREWDYDGRND